MIVTKNGVDIINVDGIADAEQILVSLNERTSLSKEEITRIVSFSGLSVKDTVRVYNRFTREVADYESFNRRKIA